MTVYQLKYDQLMQVSGRIVHLKTNKKQLYGRKL